MLDATLTAQLRTHLTKIIQPVEIVASLDDSPKSSELAGLLDEIAATSERISVRKDGDAPRRPSFRIERVGTDVAVEFAGIPMGHEFTSLVLALLQVGGHPSTASPELIERIRNLEGEWHFETFVSLSCQNCPDVVQALNLMSVVNPRIRHTMVDGAVFPDEAEARGVMAVPTVFSGGEVVGQGRMTLEEIVNMLDAGAGERDREALDGRDPFDVLIVGGGPAGALAQLPGAWNGSGARHGGLQTPTGTQRAVLAEAKRALADIEKELKR